MECVICKNGASSPGIVNVTLQRDDIAIIFKKVPADVCNGSVNFCGHLLHHLVHERSFLRKSVVLSYFYCYQLFTFYAWSFCCFKNASIFFSYRLYFNTDRLIYKRIGCYVVHFGNRVIQLYNVVKYLHFSYRRIRKIYFTRFSIFNHDDFRWWYYSSNTR